MLSGHRRGGNAPPKTGLARIRLVIALNEVDQRQVARGVLHLRFSIASRVLWLSTAHLDWRLAVPKRSVPNGHSLQIFLQPVFPAELVGLAERRSLERQNCAALDLKDTDGRRCRRCFSSHHNVRFSRQLHASPNSIGSPV